MNSQRSTDLMIMAVSAALLLAGLLVWSGALSWFGRLPGDIRIERHNTRVYVPVTSMILASVVLTLLVNLLRRFF